MESRAKLLGHPIHPMLIVLPLGLFIGAVVFDAIYLWRGSTTLASVMRFPRNSGTQNQLRCRTSFAKCEPRWSATRPRARRTRPRDSRF